jgi:hypothetical protein
MLQLFKLRLVFELVIAWARLRLAIARVKLRNEVLRLDRVRQEVFFEKFVCKLLLT